MPVSTRRPQEDEIESIAEVEEDDIQHAQSDDEDGPTPGAAEGSSTPVGRASRQKPSVVGLAARAQANARARAAAASPRSSATFSQSQRGELATIVADAVAASIAQLLCCFCCRHMVMEGAGCRTNRVDSVSVGV